MTTAEIDEMVKATKTLQKQAQDLQAKILRIQSSNKKQKRISKRAGKTNEFDGKPEQRSDWAYRLFEK